MKKKHNYPGKQTTASKLTATVASIGFVVSLGGGAYYLRQNNLEMLRLRDAVFAADKNGTDVNTPLAELKVYVTTHMNTPLPRLGSEKQVQLKYTYERLVATETARAGAEREKVTADATSQCEQLLPQVRLTERVKCVQDYIQAHPVTEKTIVKELYTFDFVSPRWSPDRAGWLLLLSGFFAAILLLQLIIHLLVKNSLKE